MRDLSLLQGNLAEVKLIIQEWKRYDSGEFCWHHSSRGTTEWQQCKFWWTDVHHCSYNKSLKHKHMNMICLQVSWWVMKNCKKSVVH